MKRQDIARFLSILSALLFTTLVSWPELLSCDLWAFKDRGSFINLDYLLDKHLRLGVDTYYAYGLLPVSIQRGLFYVFGRSHWPLIGFDFLYLVLIAIFWTYLLRHVGRPNMWCFGIVAITPILHWTNPILPHALLQLSLLFSLLFVLRRRMDIALAVAVAGCFCHPSLSLVMAGLLTGAIVTDWWIGKDRSISVLARQLFPGLLCGSLLVLGLSLEFGGGSVVATVLPLRGVEHYRAVNYGLFTSGLPFLWPRGANLNYYIGSRAGWWIISTILLMVLGCFAFVRIVRSQKLEAMAVAVVLSAMIHGVFVFVAYGPTESYIIYLPTLAAGVILALSWLPAGRLQWTLVTVFIGLGLSSNLTQYRKIAGLWRDTERSEKTAGLYAEPVWAEEWSKIAELAGNHNLLLLSYGSGIHHFFPQVQGPDNWFLQPAQVLPSDKIRLLAKLQVADVVVQDLGSPTEYVDQDKDIQHVLKSICLTDVTSNFRIWRRPQDSQRFDCKDPRK